MDDPNLNILVHVDTLSGKDEDRMDVDSQWQVAYHILTVLGKVIRIFPDVATRPQKLSWTAVVEHLLFPHAWVRMAAARLLVQLFSMLPVAEPPKDGYPITSPLTGLSLTVNAEMHEL